MTPGVNIPASSESESDIGCGAHLSFLAFEQGGNSATMWLAPQPQTPLISHNVVLNLTTPVGCREESPLVS